MYLLDKADLFNVKAERREARVEEIFQLRIEEMNKDTQSFTRAAEKRIRETWAKYVTMKTEIINALSVHDTQSASRAMLLLAENMNVELPYKSRSEFIRFVSHASRRNGAIHIGRKCQ